MASTYPPLNSSDTTMVRHTGTEGASVGGTDPVGQSAPPPPKHASTIPEDDIFEEQVSPDKRRSYDDGTVKNYPGPSSASYWERRRWERERERDRDRDFWYPDHRPSQRYIEYPDRASAFGRSTGSRRERASYPMHRARYSFEDDDGIPLKHRLNRREPSSEDEEFEDYLAWKEHGGRRGGGRGGPPNKTLRDDASSNTPRRLPFITWMGNKGRGHFVATMGEFVGTTMFLFFAFAGTQVANVGSQGAQNTATGGETGFSPQVLSYIALSFGFSLMVNVWIFFRISGGLFNPAVTLAMGLTKAISVFRAFLLLIAQIAGSIFASFLVKVLFPTEFNVRTTLSKNTSVTQGVFIEAILTAELIFAIFMLAKEKHKATFMAPVGIGLTLFVSELVGVYYTGGSLNPARSFGPCVVTRTWDPEHWIYWVGPGAGAIAAVVFYRFILILQYELANPGQDEDSEKKAEIAAEEVHNKANGGQKDTTGPNAV